MIHARAPGVSLRQYAAGREVVAERLFISNSRFECKVRFRAREACRGRFTLPRQSDFLKSAVPPMYTADSAGGRQRRDEISEVRGRRGSGAVWPTYWCQGATRASTRS